MVNSAYDGQKRGISNDYERYYEGMDKTMQQKLAFTSAHFLFNPGARIADIGCGSGFGSYQFALVNPNVQVIGIDISEESIAYAKDNYRLPNLHYVVGDGENPDPRLGFFDGFLNSSVFHHITSFNKYDRQRARNALRNQFDRLNMFGTNVIRDFCAQPGDQYVFLDVSTKGTGNTPQTMSDADLLVLFSQTARPLAPEYGPGFFLEENKSPDPKFRRFRLSAKWANEFILRKDYRKDWNTEILEEYTWWTPEDWRREIEGLDARPLFIAPFWNDWFIRNRYQGKVRLFREDGSPLGFFPTNLIVSAQKIPHEHSVRFYEARINPIASPYLTIQSHIDYSTGERYDSASRPGEVIDCLPYTMDDSRLYVCAKYGYPRPIANAVPRSTPNLDGKLWSGHMLEPIAIASNGDILNELSSRTGISRMQLEAGKTALTYFPSPDTIDEKVSALHVAVKANDITPDLWRETPLAPSISGFSDSGSLRWYPAQDLLRSAQVGILPEARLEVNIYALMRNQGITPDPTLDDPLPKPRQYKVRSYDFAELQTMLERGMFCPPPLPSRPVYGLRHCRSVFTELAKDRRILSERAFEFVVPEKGASNIATAFVLARDENYGPCIGLECRADRNRSGSFLTAPSYRLPQTVTSSDEASQYVADHLGDRGYYVLTRLGEGYFSSLGITPERVYPFAVLDTPAEVRKSLTFVTLSSLFNNLEKIHDAHLLVGTLRTVHRLGLWKDLTP